MLLDDELLDGMPLDDELLEGVPLDDELLLCVLLAVAAPPAPLPPPLPVFPSCRS